MPTPSFAVAGFLTRFLIFLAWMALPLWAVEDNGNFNNHADPGASVPNWASGWSAPGIDGWNYVGQVNGASGTYLGQGWVITAAHVGAGNFLLGGVTYSLVSGSTTVIDDGNVDVVLFQITAPPSLPPLTLRPSAPVPFSGGAADSVALIGYGGGAETWGFNTVSGVNFTLQLLGRSTTDFYTTNGTTTIGTQSVTNNAMLVSGDSGGGDFIFNASSGKWELAGINEATGSSSYFVQIGAYAQQIAEITGLPFLPFITTEPNGMSLNAGAPLSLSVSAEGSGPLGYQWLKNGTAISGAKAATFTIASAAPGDSGSYSVTITNTCATITSSTVVVTVVPVTLSQLPASQVATIGQAVTYSITAQGAGPFRYQWLLNGTAISGATASAYTIAEIAASSAGNYSVAVSNAYGGVTSNVSALVPVVSQQVIQLGQSATFTATAEGTGPFTYQWQFNGTAISSATGPSYTISNALGNQGGIYTVAVTSPSGTISSSFSLVVNVPQSDVPALPAWALAILALLLLGRGFQRRSANPVKIP